MGNKQQAMMLRKEALDDLHIATHYDRKEIKHLYRQFREEAPLGFIPKADFQQLTELMGIKDQFVTELVFNAFDLNHDGVIDFGEFVFSMSVMTRGTPDEKLEFSFRLYDLDHNGYITHDEMVKIVTALYRMLGNLVSMHGEEYDTPEKIVSRIFEEMDTNRDGRLSLDEYKVGALKDPAIVQGMGLF